MKKRMSMCMLGFVVIAMTMGQASPNGCDGPGNGSTIDVAKQQEAASTLQGRQVTPTDIRFSLERYNLIRRAYWVNGQREKALAVRCEVVKPIGYVVLVTGSGAILGTYVVDGKLSSLKSYLTPVSEYYEKNGGDAGGPLYNAWVSDVDGCYGDNDDGVFWFTPGGKYMEWKGSYLYSDIPFKVKTPVLEIGDAYQGKGVER